MAIDVDKAEAISVLQAMLTNCRENPVDGCLISDTIDFVFSAKNTLTYRYILFTALLAKTVEPSVDILSLQASDDSAGAFDARTLCSKVVFPFQKMFLSDIIDGSNSDPLVNKPGRYPRLSPSNAAANGDPRRSLNLLCEDLPKLDSKSAKLSLAYLISKLLSQAENKAREASEFAEAAGKMDELRARLFLDELIDQGFGGASITLATSAMLRILFPADDGYEVVAHPMNQSGASSSQFSDVDVFRYRSPWMGVELKDKPFTDRDVSHAAQTALKASVGSLLFVGGRSSSISDQASSYFAEARKKWSAKGIYLGVMSVDSLIDFTFATKKIDPANLFSSLKKDAESMKALEPQMWIYKRVSELKNES